MSEKIIELKSVNKWFGDFQVLKDVNLEVGIKTKNSCLWSIGFRKINSNKMY